MVRQFIMTGIITLNSETEASRVFAPASAGRRHRCQTNTQARSQQQHALELNRIGSGSGCSAIITVAASARARSHRHARAQHGRGWQQRHAQRTQSKERAAHTEPAAGRSTKWVAPQPTNPRPRSLARSVALLAILPSSSTKIFSHLLPPPPPRKATNAIHQHEKAPGNSNRIRRVRMHASTPARPIMHRLTRSPFASSDCLASHQAQPRHVALYRIGTHAHEKSLDHLELGRTSCLTLRFAAISRDLLGSREARGAETHGETHESQSAAAALWRPPPRQKSSRGSALFSRGAMWSL